MRVVPGMLLLALLCTTTTGCSLFKKNTNGTGTDGGGGTAPAKFPGPPQDPLMPKPTPPPSFPANSGAVAPVGNGTVLAGEVLDADHRRVGNTYIRLVNLDEKDRGAPIDLAVDANGYFIISAKPGSTYKLIARTKVGDKMIAGEAITSAPNTRMVIAMREELANADTPPMPGSPAAQKPAEGASKNSPTPNLPATMNVPSPPPTNTPVANPPPSVQMPSYPPGIAETTKPSVPMLSIPSIKTPRPDPIRPPLMPNESKLDTGPTLVPSCVFVGRRLENLALKDSKGQTWEFKKQGAGKLILIDFWHTQCMPCRDTMPILNRLQREYGPRGLEVIGIAMEPARDERREVEAVNGLCAKLQVNYRQLMGHTSKIDVSRDFKVNAYPTLLLFDDQGNLLTHSIGRPNEAEMRVLEGIIQRQLNQMSYQGAGTR